MNSNDIAIQIQNEQDLSSKLLESFKAKDILSTRYIDNLEKYGDKMSGEQIIKSLDIFKTAKDPSGIYIVGKEVIQIDKQGNTNTIFP